MSTIRFLALSILALLASDALAAHRCESCARNRHGKIQRSHAVTLAFKRLTGFPQGRPGYQIDHIVPLACGGSDTTTNLQWLSVAEKRAKDRIERHPCPLVTP